MKFMNTFNRFAALGLVLTAVACGGASGGKAVLSPDDASGKKDRAGNMVAKAAAEGFNVAIDDFQAQEKSGSWNEASCDRVAKKFLSASDEQESVAGSKLPEALYNSGLAYQRCGNDAKAKEQFEAAVGADSQFHRARAQIALYKFQQTGDVDGAIRELDQIIRDAKFQNVEGLVSLAALQMQRGGDTSGQGCANDLSCAQLNLQRALAIDDSFMPAFNQLALYYLEQAKNAADKSKVRGKRRRGLEVSGAQKGQVNSQQLDLAALVASQAQKKNPNYAPIHNTSGLILVELQNYNGAVKAFSKARQLDPKFFEAHMNYAAVNLSFRGYGEAEKAYREALKLRPETYEAQLGLALAIRGQINPSNAKQFVEEAQKALDAAKKIEGNRAEAYYNEAILSQEYRAKTSEDPIPAYEKAIGQYEAFISKAGSDEAFAAAVKRSKERVQDIKDTMIFIKEGREMEKAQAAADAQAKADAEAAKKAEAEAAKKAEADAAAAKAAPGGTTPGGAPPGGAPPAGAAPAGAAPAPAGGGPAAPTPAAPKK
jgi:tetratricopeptide (TPR) repeat protein